MLITLLNFPMAAMTCAAKQTVCGCRWAANFIAATWSTKRVGLFSAKCKKTCNVATAVTELPKYSQSCGTLASNN